MAMLSYKKHVIRMYSYFGTNYNTQSIADGVAILASFLEPRVHNSPAQNIIAESQSNW